MRIHDEHQINFYILQVVCNGLQVLIYPCRYTASGGEASEQTQIGIIALLHSWRGVVTMFLVPDENGGCAYTGAVTVCKTFLRFRID
jgi:hypothetical protein